MKTPCENCPFRSDKILPLPEYRRKEISDSIMIDADFPCHKTTHWNEDETDYDVFRSKRCIGAAIYLEKVRKDGGLRANVAFRMGIFFGEFTLKDLDMNSPVFDSEEEFIKAGERY